MADESAWKEHIPDETLEEARERAHRWIDKCKCYFLGWMNEGEEQVNGALYIGSGIEMMHLYMRMHSAMIDIETEFPDTDWGMLKQEVEHNKKGIL